MKLINATKVGAMMVLRHNPPLEPKAWLQKTSRPVCFEGLLTWHGTLPSRSRPDESLTGRCDSSLGRAAIELSASRIFASHGGPCVEGPSPPRNMTHEMTLSTPVCIKPCEGGWVSDLFSHIEIYNDHGQPDSLPLSHPYHYTHWTTLTATEHD